MTGVDVLVNSRWVESDTAHHAIEKYRRWLHSGAPNTVLQATAGTGGVESEAGLTRRA